MKRRICVLGAVLVLFGCATAPAPDFPKPVAQSVRFVCPPFRAWSEADLKALGQALAPIPESSILIRMALDWRRYYGDAKACSGAQKQ